MKRDLVQDLNGMARMVPIDPVSMTVGSASKGLPTDAPEAKVVERAAPLKVVPPSYIPQPSEWAIPGNFTFTDTITNSTGTAETTASSTTPSSETAVAHPDSYLKSDSKQLKRDDTYGSKMNIGAIIESIRHYKESKATGTAAAHAVSPTGDALLKSSNATNATAAHDSVSSGIVPSGASKILATSAASNTSTKVHLEGQIGTLLSAAMFPAAMRAPTTSLSQASAPATTPAQSIPEHSIVPIPMSQRPNTTAPNDQFQAFVHTINTETAQSSSPAILPASASATPLPQTKEDVKPDNKLAASSSKTLSSVAPAQESGKPKTGEKLHHYLHSVALKKPATTPAQEVPAATSASSSLVTPIVSVSGNDTQAITRINTHTAVTLTQEQPVETPHAYTSAHHHHPRARRFIS